MQICIAVQHLAPVSKLSLREKCITIPVVGTSLLLFFKLVAKRLRPEDLQTQKRGEKTFLSDMKILHFMQGECFVGISAVTGRSSKDMLSDSLCDSG